ncbi:MAG: MerR family transcriptional regulator [Polyangiaceae bacterium]|jgi:DNA-binding transcriptional MerR regulator|nr:MerR family transcriptional regulator [Polyangiaceae bacterium]
MGQDNILESRDRSHIDHGGAGRSSGARHLPVLIDNPPAPAGVPAVHEAPVPDEQLLRVGDIARAVGKTVRAIHLYEEMGLLHPHRRSRGRYRLFGPDAVVRIRWISKLQELGLSLNDIRTVLLERENLSAPGAMSRMREVYRRQLEETRTQLRRLQTLERELSASLEYLESCDACDPDRLISACSECQLRERHDDPPDLVAGLSAQITSPR